MRRCAPLSRRLLARLEAAGHGLAQGARDVGEASQIVHRAELVDMRQDGLDPGRFELTPQIVNRIGVLEGVREVADL